MAHSELFLVWLTNIEKRLETGDEAFDFYEGKSIGVVDPCAIEVAESLLQNDKVLLDDVIGKMLELKEHFCNIKEYKVKINKLQIVKLAIAIVKGNKELC